MPTAAPIKPAAIWRIDSASVRSDIRDIAGAIDKTAGNRDGKVEGREIDAFIAARADADRGTSAFEEKRSAQALQSYLQGDEGNLPLALDVTFRVFRAPMTKLSDWLGKEIMGD